MKALGIHTGGHLRDKSLAFLQQHFGRSGAWYYAIARGEDDRLVMPDRPRKSSGSELRHAIGTAVFFGMLGVTFFGLIFTPVFYVVVRKFAAKPHAHEAPRRAPAE